MPNTVINFHAVYDKEWMRNIFKLLKRNYNLIALSELEKFFYEGKELHNCCHITFDDGDVSFYDVVYPIINDYKIPVSIYVSPLAAKERMNFWFQEIRDFNREVFKKILAEIAGLSDSLVQNLPEAAIIKSLDIDTIWEAVERYREKTNTGPKECVNMNIEQLKELHQSGLVEIGAHTMNHPILKNENDERAVKEIRESIEELSEILNTKIKYFAYPNGNPNLDFGSREITALRDCGIKLAFSTENKSFNRSDNPLSIPRNGISYGCNMMITAKLLLGSKWDLLKSILKGKGEDDWRKKSHRKG